MRLIFSYLFFTLLTLTATAQVSRPWSPTDLPDSVTTSEARMRFIAEYYWDKTDFSDSERLVADSSCEQAFVDFVNLVPMLSPEIQQVAFERLLTKIKGRTLLTSHFRALAEKYLFAPFSPFVNEDVYLVFLRTLDTTGQATTWDKEEIDRLELQAIGQPLLDTLITTSKGEGTTLRQAIGQGDAVLFLFDPECETCHEVQKSLEALSKGINVVALYTGENQAAYQEAVGQMPSTWTIATPTTPLSPEHLYNTQTRPALYIVREGQIAWRGYALPQR